MQTCIWPSGCHCHSLSLALVKSRLVLPFWYQLTWVVPDKGPLNGCVCVCCECVCVCVCVCARNTEAPCSRSTSTKFGKTMQCRSLKCVAVKNYNYKNPSWPTTKYTGVGTFKVRSTSTPAYLNRHIQTRQCARETRSSVTPALFQPFTRTNCAKRAFRCSVPALCNSLPTTVLDCVTVSTFKSKRKTFLFSHTFTYN